jgi:dihydrodipicolinate synthase/N-acetylneuraminate lyase
MSTGAGYYAALPTPFDADGAVDMPALAATVDLFLADGVHGLLVNGSTGEWVTQSLEERFAVAEKTVEDGCRPRPGRGRSDSR